MVKYPARRSDGVTSMPRWSRFSTAAARNTSWSIRLPRAAATGGSSQPPIEWATTRTLGSGRASMCATTAATHPATVTSVRGVGSAPQPGRSMALAEIPCVASSAMTSSQHQAP